MARTESAGMSVDDYVRTNAVGSWEARDNDTWKASDFYDWMIDCRRLLLSRDELTWLEKQTVPDRKVDVFVNMSCGTQLIPHVTLDIVDVLQALDVNFVAGTGPRFCCGKPFRAHDQKKAGERVSQSSIDRFMEWGASSAVHVCQSCQIIYSAFVAERAGSMPPLTNDHLSWFLVDRISELGDRVPWKSPKKRRVLMSTCHAVSDVHRAVHASVEELMTLIPGFEVVGHIDTTSRGAPCSTEYPGGPGILGELSEAEHDEVVREIEAVARDAGADTVVMSAHWCQREWQKFASDGVNVTHFTSLVAESLGFNNPNRYDEYWKLNDPDAVVELARPNWESWNITEEQAKKIAYKHFHPHFGGFVNVECACGGNPGRCNTGKMTLAAKD